jgi:oligopeptide/dipeptide ABC transporter ATP-binding protein
MSEPVLALDRLSVTFDTPDGPVLAVKGVSLAVAKGECLGVVGESGSGKSQTFLAALGLLAGNGRAQGSARFHGQELVGLPRQEFYKLRGRRISVVFQDPLTALTPHMTILSQMRETLAHHFGERGAAAERRCREWLERVRIPEAARRLKAYPHELSGGMRQRVTLAMAMMTGPELLIADEPTTALDATIQAQVLDLMEDLIRDSGTGLVLITHDMGVVARLADRVSVMRHGELVETGPVGDILSAPREDYTRMLLDAVPHVDGAPRAAGRPHKARPAAEATPLLAARDLQVVFDVPSDAGFFAPPLKLRAVDGVSFDLHPGETLGVVGESGCGKSTLARAVLRLVPAEAGAVTFLGRSLTTMDAGALRDARKDLQIVFQDPLASLDPRMTLGASIAEPLIKFAPNLDASARARRAGEMMAEVGLDPGLVNRYPHELSGGQNQRVGIARAMIMNPKLVVCDEAVSALDVSVQAQIVDLLIRLQAERGLSMLFISHDLAVVREVSHRVMVLYLGRVMELAETEALFTAPLHPYTRALLAAAPRLDPTEARAKTRVRLEGDLPSPLDPRAGLRFMKSKLVDDPKAAQYRPKLLEAAPGRWVSEHDPV